MNPSPAAYLGESNQQHHPPSPPLPPPPFNPRNSTRTLLPRRARRDVPIEIACESQGSSMCWCVLSHKSNMELRSSFSLHKRCPQTSLIDAKEDPLCWADTRMSIMHRDSARDPFHDLEAGAGVHATAWARIDHVRESLSFLAAGRATALDSSRTTA